MDSTPLAHKTCIPCQANLPPMAAELTQKFLSELGADWQINSRGHLYKPFKFKDFAGAMDFAQKIADLAEKEGHHPDLTISWGLCTVELWTHKIQGLSESDFILAAKIEAIR